MAAAYETLSCAVLLASSGRRSVSLVGVTRTSSGAAGRTAALSWGGRTAAVSAETFAIAAAELDSAADVGETAGRLLPIESELHALSAASARTIKWFVVASECE
jgi:hypothetical protein